MHETLIAFSHKPRVMYEPCIYCFKNIPHNPPLPSTSIPPISHPHIPPPIRPHSRPLMLLLILPLRRPQRRRILPPPPDIALVSLLLIITEVGVLIASPEIIA
ncbi:MAG: hypothetical protein KKG76_14520 [Euryarchaeota archaeon]|nr:hypothetical protein [Euryarchaeota archaeon]